MALGDRGPSEVLVKKLEFLNFPHLASATPSEKGGWIEDLAQVLAARDSIII